MVCAALSGRQSRKAAQRDVVHRASGLTHSVGLRAPPFGSRPGARPSRAFHARGSARCGPQPYSLMRFSVRSLRIERLGATQAVTLVRNAGLQVGRAGGSGSKSHGIPARPASLFGGRRRRGGLRRPALATLRSAPATLRARATSLASGSLRARATPDHGAVHGARLCCQDRAMPCEQFHAAPGGLAPLPRRDRVQHRRGSSCGSPPIPPVPLDPGESRIK